MSCSDRFTELGLTIDGVFVSKLRPATQEDTEFRVGSSESIISLSELIRISVDLDFTRAREALKRASQKVPYNVDTY